jgi:primosomal protein N' (replication factor Y)
VKQFILKIAIDTPLDQYFDYRWTIEDEADSIPLVGQLAFVPFGRREVVGMIMAVTSIADTNISKEKLKDVIEVRKMPPLNEDWLALCKFAANYYHRPLGEVVLPGLPKNLKATKATSLDRALKNFLRTEVKEKGAISPKAKILNDAQQQAVAVVAKTNGYTPVLLYGVTGSGKTEVYLETAARILAASEEQQLPAQILILVPEINLTPQLQNNIQARFPDIPIATLHSGLSEGERLKHWLEAHLGKAKIILGTRLAILASIPHLKLIIVDEEHDPSYKQQEGLRYSARDLAIWRAHQLAIPIVLGSATPSLESWQHAQSKRYRVLCLPERAVKNAALPHVKLIDMERDKPADGLTSSLIAALRRRLEQGEQSLLFLNRRGYAPVIACDACGWISNCTRCTAFMVLHKSDYRLRCHHCGFEQRIPKACPTCGNIDLQPFGRGTQRVEENLHQLFPQARIIRIDADSTRRKGSAQAAFDTVHRGEIDILIGTQMVAKGHDFRNLTLVGILNPDTALFSHDYRASERLFAQLMQVAGRAGRAGQKEGGNPSEVLIQTRYVQHPLYAAVIAHNYDRFATSLLEERKQACLPPFIFQALLRAEAGELKSALDFLQQAASYIDDPRITVNDPIPMTLTRVANTDRAQLLIESSSRPALQDCLSKWMDMLRQVKTRVKWSLEVDPIDI